MSEALGSPKAAAVKTHTLAEHTRRAKNPEVGEAESVPFFDDSQVPVETIRVPNPLTEGLTPDQYEVISQKVTYRLCITRRCTANTNGCWTATFV